MNSRELMMELAPVFHAAYLRGLNYEFSAIKPQVSDTTNLLVYKIREKEIWAPSVTMVQCYAYCPFLLYDGIFVQAISFVRHLAQALEGQIPVMPGATFASTLLITEDTGPVKVALRFP